MSLIELLITACLFTNPAACSDIRAETPFLSVAACEAQAQPALAQIMAAYPKRRVARYKCEEVRRGREA